MEESAVEVVCRRRSGHWEISVPDVPDLALKVDRLEDVPSVVRRAIATTQDSPDDAVRVLLDVRGR
ncbi:MAG: hypothetical protein JO222_14565 [Frankiales bacterium]|nr:hypothetical protein [Frankiales bacterium]